MMAYKETSTDLSTRLTDIVNSIPKLTREQCGHIRHIHNLASQMDGDWAFMGSQEPGQEWDFARRYQLGHMTYAAGAAHYHHLPAMKAMFKVLFEKLIHKMLNKEVWDYWYLTSQSGKKMDPDLKELRKPWVDPVCKENIMYSGHLACMIALYTMLFHDYRYDEKDSILFEWNPIFFGMGRETYGYTRHSLQEAILKEMERENWMGVCCEPNMIFIICNQFPILSFRYNDAVDGSHTVDDVLPKYKAAWSKKGMIGENGLFRRNYFPNQANYGVNEDIGHTVWAMAFMPWNYSQTLPLYPSIANGFLEKVNDRTNIHPPTLANAIRNLAVEEGNAAPGDSSITQLANDPSLIARAKEIVKDQPHSTKRLQAPTFGWVAMWVSEYGSSSDLDALLRHADTYLNPTWSRGGLYYERKSDLAWDEEGNYRYVDPNTGNGCIAYARLNVKNGLKKMWDEPWTRQTVERRPYIDNVTLDQGCDCLRGRWDEDNQAMIATFRTWNDALGQPISLKPIIKGLPTGRYSVFVDGRLGDVQTVRERGDEVDVKLDVGVVDVDLVVVRWDEI